VFLVLQNNQELLIYYDRVKYKRTRSRKTNFS